MDLEVDVDSNDDLRLGPKFVSFRHSKPGGRALRLYSAGSRVDKFCCMSIPVI